MPKLREHRMRVVVQIDADSQTAYEVISWSHSPKYAREAVTAWARDDYPEALSITASVLQITGRVA